MKTISAGLMVIVGCTIFTACNQTTAQSVNQTKMEKKILFVVTSHDQKGDTEVKTGYYLSEVSHPWEILHSAGYEIDFVSPKGGKAPVDGFNMDDPVNKKFWNDKVYRNKVENTLKPSEVNPKDYIAIHYAGGHGTMWDFADNEKIAEIERNCTKAKESE